ncbi:hypothetical protein ACME9Q_24720 (plasmid) [Escherichia coli]
MGTRSGGRSRAGATGSRSRRSLSASTAPGTCSAFLTTRLIATTASSTATATGVRYH